MHTRSLFPVLALTALAACFSERAELTSPPSTIGKEACDAASPPENVVLIRNFSFQPSQLRVSKGTQVTWVNCDSEGHTSTSDAGSSEGTGDTWDSRLLTSGASYSRTFDQAGTTAYHCEPHPFMKGSVTVQ